MDLEARGFIHRVVNGQHVLVPADIASEDLLNGIKVNREVLVTIRQPRHPEHHRWFFWMLNLIVERVPGWDDVDDLLDAIKLSVGHVRRVKMMGSGDVMLLPRSIAFANLGEDAFKRFVNRAKYVIGVALKIDVEALVKEVDAHTKAVAR